MTEAWATWTASLPRDSSRSERTAMTSLYSMTSPVSTAPRPVPLPPPPPAEDEEGRREADQAPRDVRSHDVAEARRLVHAERVQEERPEHGDRDREHDAQGEAVQPVVLAVQLPFPRIEGVDEQVPRQEEQEHEGPDHTRRRGDGAEDIVRQRAAPPARVYLKIVRGARTGGKGLGVGPLHPPPEVPERNGIASRPTCAAWTTSSGAGSRTDSSSS